MSDPITLQTFCKVTELCKFGTVDAVTSPTGLRDRKKAATRSALAAAAVELARERGLHEVTADAIAARAGVSTRTFHNYFASKEEAVLHHLEGVIEEMIEVLRNRPADEHILDSLEVCAFTLLSDPAWSFEEINACMVFIEENAVQLARHIQVERRSSQLLVDAIAERTGTDPATDLYPNLLHHVTTGALKAAIEMHVSGSSTPVEELLREAFAGLRRGFGRPQPRP